MTDDVWGWLCPECGEAISKSYDHHMCRRIGQPVLKKDCHFLLIQKPVAKSKSDDTREHVAGLGCDVHEGGTR